MDAWVRKTNVFACKAEKDKNKYKKSPSEARRKKNLPFLHFCNHFPCSKISVKISEIPRKKRENYRENVPNSVSRF